MDRILDPEGSRERLSAWKGRIDQLAADTKTMSDQMQELRVTVADPNKLVEVTVDSSGNLLDLYLSERTKRVDTEMVSRTIMEAIRAAKAEVAARSTEIIESTLGTESPAARAIAERVRQQLTPAEDEEGQGNGIGLQR